MSAPKDLDPGAPGLATDADVDALMARLRARLESTPPAADVAAADPASLTAAIDDVLAAHDGLTGTVVRALEAIVETLEEFAADDLPEEGGPIPDPESPQQRARHRAAR